MQLVSSISHRLCIHPCPKRHSSFAVAVKYNTQSTRIDHSLLLPSLARRMILDDLPLRQTIVGIVLSFYPKHRRLTTDRRNGVSEVGRGCRRFVKSSETSSTASERKRNRKRKEKEDVQAGKETQPGETKDLREGSPPRHQVGTVSPNTLCSSPWIRGSSPSS